MLYGKPCLLEVTVSMLNDVKKGQTSFLKHNVYAGEDKKVTLKVIFLVFDSVKKKYMYSTCITQHCFLFIKCNKNCSGLKFKKKYQI